MSENLSFDHGSAASDVTTDPQLPWNGMQASAQNRLPDYRSLSETNTQYLQHVRRGDPWNAEWSLGESSASQQQNQPSNILALDNAGVISNGNQPTNGSSFRLPNSSYALTQDLNLSSGQEDDVERHGMQVSIGLPNEMQSAGGMDNGGDSSGCSLDGRRMSCKRKAIELNGGQSSGVGSSSCFQTSERSPWHNVPNASQIPSSAINTPIPTDNDLFINSGSEQANPRLRLGVGGAAASANPFLSCTSSSSRRNCRLRFNSSYPQDHPNANNPFSTEASDVANATGSSSHPSITSFFDLNPSLPLENGNIRAQLVSHIPSIHRNHQSRWTGATSSTRASSSSSSAIPGDWNAAVFEEPDASRTIPRSISEHPMFIPGSETGSSSQNPVNWNLASGSNVAGNVAVPLPRAGAGYSATPGLSHRNSRRLSELVRRSLLSSAGTESGSQSSNLEMRARSLAANHEMALPHRPDGNRHRVPNSRSLLDRHGAFAVPYSLRTLAAANEGRSNVMSEIRHVLDLMRRGEGLRLEDVMILDHSVFFGMADVHDRHRDMRLDVDNMSYEELLALEERIGNVCTGLSEETIMNGLKQHKYVDDNIGQTETEPCSICREEYAAGEDIGALNCGHDFHRDCIKQWLLVKNLCPICKTTGLKA